MIFELSDPMLVLYSYFAFNRPAGCAVANGKATSFVASLQL